MNDWNDNHYFTPLEKAYIIACGMIVALGICYITFLYYEYRVVNNLWTETFVSPKEYWAEVPNWEWRPIWQKT